MRMFFFDMKDGVPLRDLIGLEFLTSAEAIEHSKELALRFRDKSLRDDQDLEISVINASGREIHREFVIGKPKTSISGRLAVLYSEVQRLREQILAESDRNCR
jgi:hypothetical protein